MSLSRAALSLALLTTAACGDAPSYGFDPVDPTGPYEVGVHDLTRVDADRAEPLGPEGPRRYVATVWYPAEPTGQEARYPWLGRFTMDELKPLSRDDEAMLQAMSEVDTVAWADAPGAGDDLPALVFSPGYGTMPEVYTVVAQDLASHGYVVVTLNHPYDVAATDLGDGEVVYGEARMLRMILQGALGAMSLPGMEPGPEKAEKTERVLSHNKYLQELTRIRAADIGDAIDLLDEIEAGEVEALSTLAGRLDLDRVGAFGHSLGGAAAVQAALDDPRIGAAANWDGSQWGDVYGQDVGAPVLFVETGSMPGFNDMIYADVSELEHRYHDEWRHAGLTDLPFIVGMDPEAYAEQHGDIEPEEAVLELATETRGFFDRALGG